MSESNRETLRSYDRRIQQYIDGTAQTLAGEAKDWLDAALSALSPQARILEIGSAFGRDAAYIASRGFSVACTDAVPGFVAHLQAKGFAARLLNALTDDLDGPYDLILANAVMLHFTRDDFSVLLRKIARALGSGGRFAFSLKRGRGESWSEAKIEAPRFFCYWEEDQLPPLLAEAGFAGWNIQAAQTQRAHADWLFIIAQTR